MDAFAVAAELLGNRVELTSTQLAGLRAINHKHFTEVYALLHPPGAEPGPAALTAAQSAALRATLERDVLALLTEAQRERLGRWD